MLVTNNFEKKKIDQINQKQKVNDINRHRGWHPNLFEKGMPALKLDLIYCSFLEPNLPKIKN